jgi:tripartite-type tricarboxylate transporter receptor subunit TctC
VDRRTLLGAACAALVGVAIPRRAWAGPDDTYPNRTVTIILPFAPGSAADGMTRLCAQALAQRFGQSFIVENIGGASGTIGTARVARAEPDGYTLVIGSSATITVAPYLFKKLPYDPVKDLVPIVTLGDSPMVVAVARDAPFHTLAELVAAAKAKPGTLSFGSGGSGSAAHIAAEIFQWKTATKLVHVPYRGVAAAVPDLIAGRLDALFVSYPAVEPMAHSGAIRVLAVAAKQRSNLVPDTPTAAEAGVNGFELSAWNGLMAPVGTPGAIIAKLNAALNAILADPALVKRLAGMGMAPIPRSPEAFTVRIRNELVEMDELTKVARITAD